MIAQGLPVATVQATDTEGQPLLLHPARKQNKAHVLWESPREFGVACAAEFLATATLVLVGCGSSVSEAPRAIADFEVSTAFASTIALLIIMFGGISGAHLNPAVSLAFFLTRQFSLAKAAAYGLAQTLGALAGAAVLYGLVPNATNDWGQTTLAEGVAPLRGVLVECVATYFLVTVVLFVGRHPSPDKGNQRLATAIGVYAALMALQLFAAPLTGCSMNPARSFGPAVISTSWDAHWVYWVGPLAGAAIASIVYLFFTHCAATF